MSTTFASSVASIAPPTESSGSTKLPHLQILRALAASLVVVNHTTAPLEERGLHFASYRSAGEVIGSLGVSTFFVLSGLIMVRQSGNRFGQARSPLLFAWHRILRIVPMYWIATLLWHTTLMLRRAQGRAIQQTILSLLFIPNYPSGLYRLNPILGQGWTLNYEMAFYLLFTLALFLPRRAGIAAILAVIALVAWAGSHFHPAIVAGPADILRFYTDPVICLFAVGVMIGSAELLLRATPMLRFPLSPALLILAPAALLLIDPLLAERLPLYSTWEVCLAFSVVVLSSLTANRSMGRIARGLVLLGDASYSTYLFHLWVFPWIVPPILAIYGRLHRIPETPWAFLLAAILVANALGLLLHVTVERPCLRWLRGGRRAFAG